LTYCVTKQKIQTDPTAGHPLARLFLKLRIASYGPAKFLQILLDKILFCDTLMDVEKCAPTNVGAFLFLGQQGSGEKRKRKADAACF
jgi:hypothetical protein